MKYTHNMTFGFLVSPVNQKDAAFITFHFNQLYTSYQLDCLA